MHYKSRKFGILTYLALSLTAPVAYSATYIAPHDNSKWTTHTSKLQCDLTHEIPGYGSATFSQEAGKRQTFALQSSVGRLQEGEIIVSQVTSPWSGPKKSQELARVSAQTGLTPLKLNKMTVYELLDGLHKGYQASFTFSPSNATTNKQVKTSDEVVVSPTGFAKSYEAYLACLDSLVPLTFHQLKNSTVTFKSASKAIAVEDETLLDMIADWVNSDEAVYKVKLEGHSDSVGSFTSNRRLSYERAWLIKDYLVDMGIQPEKIEVKGFGDRKPIAKNTTSKGRAQNRRVEIKLYR